MTVGRKLWQSGVTYRQCGTIFHSAFYGRPVNIHKQKENSSNEQISIRLLKKCCKSQWVGKKIFFSRRTNKTDS